MSMKDIRVDFPGIDSSANIPTAKTIRQASESIGVVFGPLLESYLRTYGYLGFLSAELLGVNELQKDSSDLVRVTRNMREYYHQADNCVVVDDLGDGQYVLCDSMDRIYQMPDDVTHAPVPMGKNLEEYIRWRFNQVSRI